MNNKRIPQNGFCMPGNPEESCDCSPKELVIKEEEEALAVLRDLKKQVHSRKARIAELKQELVGDSQNAEMKNELKKCEEKLKELRVQWDEWDKKRQEATRQKLIRLGHISPDDPSWKVT